jgi:hypothetical protein
MRGLVPNMLDRMNLVTGRYLSTADTTSIWVIGRDGDRKKCPSGAHSYLWVVDYPVVGSIPSVFRGADQVLIYQVRGLKSGG